MITIIVIQDSFFFSTYDERIPNCSKSLSFSEDSSGKVLKCVSRGYSINKNKYFHISNLQLELQSDKICEIYKVNGTINSINTIKTINNSKRCQKYNLNEMEVIFIPLYIERAKENDLFLHVWDIRKQE